MSSTTATRQLAVLVPVGGRVAGAAGVVERLAGQRGPLVLAVAGEVQARPPSCAGLVEHRVGVGRRRCPAPWPRRAGTWCAPSSQATACCFGVGDRRRRAAASSCSQVIGGTLNCICAGSTATSCAGQRAERLELLASVGSAVRSAGACEPAARPPTRRRRPSSRRPCAAPRCRPPARRGAGRGGVGASAARGRRRRSRWRAGACRSAAAAARRSPRRRRCRRRLGAGAAAAPAAALPDGAGVGGCGGHAAVAGGLEHLAEAQLGRRCRRRLSRPLFSPGSEITMLRLPSVTTSASATPRALTRLSMISRACSRLSASARWPSSVLAPAASAGCRRRGPGRAWARAGRCKPPWRRREERPSRYRTTKISAEHGELPRRAHLSLEVVPRLSVSLYGPPPAQRRRCRAGVPAMSA